MTNRSATVVLPPPPGGEDNDSGANALSVDTMNRRLDAVVTEWALTEDGRWRIVDPIEKIASMVARAREMTEANRRSIRRSRELLAAVWRRNRIRHAWQLQAPPSVQ